MQWHQKNITSGEPTWVSNDGRFTIQWVGRSKRPVATYRLYDTKTRSEYFGFINHGRAMELADHIAYNTVIRVGLVACCSEKKTEADCACLLYQSQLFQSAFDYCERHYDLVYILSAKYGFVKPTQVIEPYNRKLTVADGPSWGAKVVGQINSYLKPDASMLFFAHAGRLYVDPLVHLLPMSLPVRGLGIGEQLSFYKHRQQK